MSCYRWKWRQELCQSYTALLHTHTGYCLLTNYLDAFGREDAGGRHTLSVDSNMP